LFGEQLKYLTLINVKLHKFYEILTYVRGLSVSCFVLNLVKLCFSHTEIN